MKYSTKIKVYVLNSPQAEFFDEIDLIIYFDVHKDKTGKYAHLTNTSLDLVPLRQWNKNLNRQIDEAIYESLSNV